MGLIVQKFGGTSVADPQRIHRAATRALSARATGQRVVMVVSAMGDATDRLITLAREVSRNPPKRELDMLLTTGEQASIALMAMAIADQGGRAISLTAAQVGLVTDSHHARARIQRINKDRIAQELVAERIVICAGFQGIDEGGEITTLGRGASDTTATALAGVLGADVCEIYTDVDGIYTADPRTVSDARKIDAISYDEMLEMAGLGAQVMHSRAVEFAKKFDVPIHVRSSQKDITGTMITASTPGMEDVVVRGVTLKKNLAVLELIDVPNEPGIAALIFTRIAAERIIVDDIFQNIYRDGRLANIGFTIEGTDLPDALRIANALHAEWGGSKLAVAEQMCKVSVTGIGMRSHSGVAQVMFAALHRHGINIQNITTSEIVISCIVQAGDGPRAVQVVHDAFGLGGETAAGR